MTDRYVYLDIDHSVLTNEKDISITVKLDDEGVVVDAWGQDPTEVLATTYKFYQEMELEVKEIKTFDSVDDEIDSAIIEYSDLIYQTFKGLNLQRLGEDLIGFMGDYGSEYGLSQDVIDHLKGID